MVMPSYSLPPRSYIAPNTLTFTPHHIEEIEGALKGSFSLSPFCLGSRGGSVSSVFQFVFFFDVDLLAVHPRLFHGEILWVVWVGGE